MAIGTTWATNSWTTTSWEDNSCGAAGIGDPENLGDLTFLFADYLADLRAANPGKDLTTLLAQALATVRAARSDELDDANTMYGKYLS
jgi:hypothetical protein